MSAITTPTCIGKDPPGSGTLFDRITGFSNEKLRFSGEEVESSSAENSRGQLNASARWEDAGRRSSTSNSFSSSSPIDYAKTPSRGRLETTVLDFDNVVHSPKRFFTEAASNASFLDCAISPIKRERSRPSPVAAKKQSERSQNNTSATLSLSRRSEQSIANEWREVKDPVSGKMYYYNRLTRVSKWKLPNGAVLRRSSKHKSNNTSATLSITRNEQSHDPTNAYSHSFATAVTDESSLSHLHNSLQLNQDRERKIPEVTSSQTASASDHFSPRKERSGHSSPQTLSTHSSSPHSTDDEKIAFATTSDIKSPQDTTFTGSLLFCLYCGLKCRSLSILESHLQQCSCFMRMQDPDLLSTQMEIERMLFNLWSKTGSNTHFTDKELLHSPIKETFVSSSHSQGPFQSPDKENKRNESSQTFSSLKFNVREQRNNRIDFCIDKKTCPFCEEALVGGDQFSSHLLKCKMRKRIRNKRRTPKKDTAVAEEIPPRFRAGVRTPGRKMPWE